jgi:hypothetical protein
MQHAFLRNGNIKNGIDDTLCAGRNHTKTKKPGSGNREPFPPIGNGWARKRLFKLAVSADW